MRSPEQRSAVSGSYCECPPQATPKWYVLQTQPRHERAVERRLRDHGMETFLPTLVEVRRWSDRSKKIEVPLFECYVFLRCALTGEERRCVNRIESILGFVGAHGTSLPIPDDDIARIRKVVTQPASCRSHPFLEAGQRVRVRGGAMDGVEGIFVRENGDRSLVISVEAIQRSVAVRIFGYDVEPI